MSGSSGFGLLPDDWALPELNALTTPWFTSREFAVQRCESCGTRQHPPEEVCHACGGSAFDHDVLSPLGHLHSYTVVHHAVNAALAESVPYVVALVALDDDPSVRVVANVTGVTRDAIAIGMAMRAYWVQRTAHNGDVIHLPLWCPR